MSYADARLDLTAVAVACLAGHNGAGKSAILDAITWALWEQARSDSDELIRLGQAEMWVEVVFALEGVDYRVRRSRQKSSGRKSGRVLSRGSLDLQVATGEGWRSLTAPSGRETQKQISQLLRMDYDTFVNSVYLRQGRADEFTTRLPSERKQILSEILGLSYFDQLQELSREKCRSLKSQLDTLAVALHNLPELGEKTRLEEKTVERLAESLNEAGDKWTFHEQTARLLREQIKEAEHCRQKLESGQERRAELSAYLSAAQKQLSDLEFKHDEIVSLIGMASEIEALNQSFCHWKQIVETLDKSAQVWQDLTTRRLQIQSELARIKSRLEVNLEHLHGRREELNERRNQLMRPPEEAIKIEQAYLQFKETLKRESEMALRQEAYAKLALRADQLSSLVHEARIRLESEIQQKEAAEHELSNLILASTTLDEERQEINRQVEELEKLEAEFELVEKAGLSIKSEMEASIQAVKELERRQDECRARIRELEERSDSSICPLCSATIVDRLAVIARYRQDIDALGRVVACHSARQSELEIERSELRKRYVEIKARLDKRKQLDVMIGQFNEKSSAIDRAKAGAGQLAAELDKLKKQLADMQYAIVERESLVNIKAEIYKLDFDPVLYANLQAQIRAQRHNESRYQQWRRDQSELEKLTIEIPSIDEEIASMTRQMASGDYARELTEQLEMLDKETLKLDYNREKHQEAKQKLVDLIDASAKAAELERAYKEWPTCQQALESCRQMIADKRQQLDRLETNLAEWKESADSLKQKEEELLSLEPLLAHCSADRDRLATELAVARSRVEQWQIEQQKLDQQLNQSKKLTADLEDFQLLSEAFGKKGIQAAIIENAIPEIEAESNRILSRLSDNQMHIALVTQYKNKSGNLIETLDLLIADELGTRSYELYSGGESFKVNFAVRVALSRLLTRRAGARLETLIIDEGFGSQDEASRERLVQVIGQIQNDFARILAVTHISEVKEMFPAHIYVSKRNGQSEIQVV